MSFIQRELDRIGDALRQPRPNNRYAELYAAQQALIWATDPTDFKSPFDMLGVTSTPEGSEDCQEESDHSQS
jgi:hypothetical protein